MKLLLVGGSGAVAGEIIPHLAERHSITVFDLRPPRAHLDVRYVAGDARDSVALHGAMSGVDGVVHLASYVPRGAEAHDGLAASRAFDVNVGSIYALALAVEGAEPQCVVHLSSMSVYGSYGDTVVDAAAPPDATAPYGLSKRCAEMVLAELSSAGGWSAISLRVAHPTPDDVWPRWIRPSDGEAVALALSDGTPMTALSAVDLAAAIETALEHRGRHISVDVAGDEVAMLWSASGRLLGWRPSR